MKSKPNKKEEGITLVALIITIIVLVILAAVSVAAIYNSKIVEYAVNGSLNYSEEALRENEIMNGTESLLDSAVSQIHSIIGEGNVGNNEDKPEETKPPLDISSIKAGDYVDYTYDSKSYTSSLTYNGYGNQNFTSTSGLTWRVLDTDTSSNTVTLVSTNVANTGFYLKGADGYNNAVYLLNEACSTMYSNSALGLTARSINQDDIDKITNMTTDAQREAVNSSYGTTYTPSNYYWPTIYGQEPGKTGGGSLDRSAQSTTYTGTQHTRFTGKWTYYYYSISSYAKSTTHYAMLTCQTGTSGSTSHTVYWVASRCMYLDTSYGWFRVFHVSSGYVAALDLYRSCGFTWSHSTAVRPVVSVNLNSYSIGATGTGSNSAPYSISKK